MIAYSLIFHDPMMALNPVLTIGEQMIEAVLAHRLVSRAETRDRRVKVLARVGIPSPADRMRACPHEFWGGMRQRVVIAIAFLNDPELIIADEATTALDVTIQSQIIAEIQSLAAETDTAILWITHDLSLLSGFADHVMVMYAGQVVENAPSDQIFAAPRHPYTAALMQAVPVPGCERLVNLPGVLPALDALPSGCAFSPRCFDPSNPHPTPGGAVTSGGALMAGGMFDQKRMKTLDHPGSARLLGQPLMQDLLLTDLTLHATGTAERPFDLHAMLFEELPCGAVINITDGIVRCAASGPLELGFAPTFYLACRGNRLGLVLAGSNFPRHDFASHHPWSLNLKAVTIRCGHTDIPALGV